MPWMIEIDLGRDFYYTIPSVFLQGNNTKPIFTENNRKHKLLLRNNTNKFLPKTIESIFYWDIIPTCY